MGSLILATIYKRYIGFFLLLHDFNVYFYFAALIYADKWLLIRIFWKGWGCYRHGWRSIRCKFIEMYQNHWGNIFKMQCQLKPLNRSTISEQDGVRVFSTKKPRPVQLQKCSITEYDIVSNLVENCKTSPLHTFTSCVMFFLEEISYCRYYLTMTSIWIMHFTSNLWAALSCSLWSFKICRIYFFLLWPRLR